VTLTKPYYIGIFEVTQAQWFNVMGNTKASAKSGNTIPANGVPYTEIRGTVNGGAWPAHNQVDASSFMGRLRSKANMMFDLPTEAQWEYACRAGTSTALNSGKNLTTTGGNRCANLDELAWYYPRSGGSAPTTVGNYLANAWGLYDMHGNVMEWCLDWIENNLGSGATTDPKGPASNLSRVLRGGGYSSTSNGGYWGHPQSCRSAARLSSRPSSSNDGVSREHFGFRVCCLSSD